MSHQSGTVSDTRSEKQNYYPSCPREMTKVRAKEK